jgi:hypothetical protein
MKRMDEDSSERPDAKASASAPELPISGQWLHSFEEDTGDVQVYRPLDHEFPPARRGREGIEFLPDGTFIDKSVGPADAHVKTQGRWEYAGSGTVRLTFEDPQRRARVVEVVECDEQKLCIRRSS